MLKMVERNNYVCCCHITFLSQNVKRMQTWLDFILFFWEKNKKMMMGHISQKCWAPFVWAARPTKPHFNFSFPFLNSLLHDERHCTWGLVCPSCRLAHSGWERRGGWRDAAVVGGVGGDELGVGAAAISAHDAWRRGRDAWRPAAGSRALPWHDPSHVRVVLPFSTSSRKG
jgi:hypothetical protein